MLRSERADEDWQALRYAVDMIDHAWSLDDEKTDAKMFEMEAHRETIVNLQESALRKKRAYEEIER